METPADPVNHPPHYTYGEVETKDYIKQTAAIYPGEEAWLVANIIKYVSRAPLKGKKLSDLKKAQFYLEELIGDLEDKPDESGSYSWQPENLGEISVG